MKNKFYYVQNSIIYISLSLVTSPTPSHTPLGLLSAFFFFLRLMSRSLKSRCSRDMCAMWEGKKILQEKSLNQLIIRRARDIIFFALLWCCEWNERNNNIVVVSRRETIATHRKECRARVTSVLSLAAARLSLDTMCCVVLFFDRSIEACNASYGNCSTYQLSLAQSVQCNQWEISLGCEEEIHSWKNYVV